VFSIRELSSNIPYTATLYVNSVATAFNAVIPDGATSFSIAVNNTPLQLNQLDLISIFLSYTGGGALSNGMCATIIATPN
jgi:actin-like ATPase involved in cell morphogenesis